MYFVDGEPLNIVGVGDVRLKMSKRFVWKIQRLIHVPKLMDNLISIG